MSEIKAGMVVTVKTTDEPVFVLSIGQSESESLSGVIATVRRPTQGGEGISHRVDTFYIEELETLDMKKKRYLDEYTNAKELIDAQKIPGVELAAKAN